MEIAGLIAFLLGVIVACALLLGRIFEYFESWED